MYEVTEDFCSQFASLQEFIMDEIPGIAYGTLARQLLCHPQTCVVFIPALPDAFSSIPNVSGGELCSKTQNFVLARCFVAHICKCDEAQSVRTACLHLMTATPEIVELALKGRHECYLLLTEIPAGCC
jgi:hypothetical protein